MNNIEICTKYLYEVCLKKKKTLSKLFLCPVIKAFCLFLFFVFFK